jgi:hypothetical protein
MPAVQSVAVSAVIAAVAHDVCIGLAKDTCRLLTCVIGTRVAKTLFNFIESDVKVSVRSRVHFDAMAGTPL